MEVYLDNSATTRVFPQVAELMHEIMLDGYGNPSSLHKKGMEAEGYLRTAKETFAKLLKVAEKELFFTSGGTESDNLALIGAAMANSRQGRHLITTQVEHPAILQTMKHLEEKGFQVTYLPVDRSGRIRIEDLAKSLRPDTILVSMMHTNNEVGAVMPIAEAGALIKRFNPRILFHVDAVQGFGKARILPKRMNIDMLSVSGHKIHGPKGVGLLYVAEKTKLMPIVYGGGQQMGVRSGTENVPGIAGMAKAANLLYADLENELERLYELKSYFIDGVSKIDNVVINGIPENPNGLEAAIRNTAPHIVSVSFAGVRSEVLLHALEEKGIYVSAGSACSAHKPQPSATLRAMKVEPALLESTLRFSFSVFTTKEGIDYTLDALYGTIPLLRRFTRH